MTAMISHCNTDESIQLSQHHPYLFKSKRGVTLMIGCSKLQAIVSLLHYYNTSTVSNANLIQADAETFEGWKQEK